MQRILKAFPPGTTHLGWFADEGQGVRLTSKAAMPVLASDYFLNLEVWTSMQNVEVGDLAGASPATTGPTASAGGSLEGLAREPKAYISFTISDGDIRTATPNDELVAGPSGAGYILPSCWPAKGLPAFLQLTGELMRAMNLKVIEVLDASLWPSMAFFNQKLQQNYVEALAPFGIRGVLSGAGMKVSSWRNVSGVPVLQNLGLADSVDKTVRLIRNARQQTTSQASTQFLNIYILAWSMTPSDLKQVIQQLGDEYVVVTPGRLLQMIAGGLHE